LMTSGSCDGSQVCPKFVRKRRGRAVKPGMKGTRQGLGRSTFRTSTLIGPNSPQGPSPFRPVRRR
jgi:hypothetical protein